MVEPISPQQSPGDAISSAINQIVDGALSTARAEVQAQLALALKDRAALEDRLATTQSSPARRDLQQQLEVVNVKISKLQSALAGIGNGMSKAEAKGKSFASTAPPAQPFPPPDNFNPAPMVISIMAILFIGFPLALTFARLMWRRATNAPPPAMNVETGRRFDRLEQSVDAIAIEVERISENQRYLTKLLAESKQGALKE